MEEPESMGVARAKTIGTAFAAFGLLAGGLGLFAGGTLAVIGTVAAVGCVAGVCAAKMAEQLESHRDRLVECWPTPADAEPATLAINQEIAVSLPEKSFVAMLGEQRPGGRIR